MSRNTKLALRLLIPLAVALVSIFVLGRHFAKVETYPNSIAYLDGKKVTVTELAGAATAASVAITAIPGDVATPIAEKLADLSSYFLLIVCAIFLEKYLITLTGALTFYILIPLACLAMMADCFVKSNVCRNIALRLAAFGLAIFILVPVSVKAGQMIENTYSDAIAQSLNAPQSAAEDITGDLPAEEAAPEAPQQSWWQRLIQQAQETVEQVKQGVTSVPEKVETTLSQFIEAVAVLIVTSCLIPLLVVAALIWLTKAILGLEINQKGVKWNDKFTNPFSRKKE